MAYDSNNVFAKILLGEIPCTKLYEDAHALAFADIAPSAPVHVLVLPKAAYTDYDDFLARASEAEIVGFFRAIRNVAHGQGVGDSYRLISNYGVKSGQSVPHFHMHILAGKQFGALVAD